MGTPTNPAALLSLFVLLNACSLRVSCTPDLCGPKAPSINRAG